MSRTSKFILALTLLLAAIVCVGWTISAYEAAQEKTIPYYTMDYLLDETDGSYWAEGIRERAHLTVTEFEDEAAVIDTLLCAPLTSNQISYREIDDPAVYMLSADNRDFCLVTLAPTEETAGFGLHYWQIERTEILESYLQPEPRTVEITGPIDMRIRLNGKPVSTRYAVKTDDPDIVRFRIEGIYADYSLDVFDEDNNRLTCTASNDDTYIYTK